jgi:hypothetical protein
MKAAFTFGRFCGLLASSVKITQKNGSVAAPVVLKRITPSHNAGYDDMREPIELLASSEACAIPFAG